MVILGRESRVSSREKKNIQKFKKEEAVWWGGGGGMHDICVIMIQLQYYTSAISPNDRGE